MFRDAIGRRRRQSNLSQREINLIIDLHLAGKSWREIGQLMGREWTGLARRHRQYGVRLRPLYKGERRWGDPTVVNYKPLKEWPSGARF